MPLSAAPGWTIQQAFERTLEPAHWREFLLAEQSWRQSGSNGRFLRSGGICTDPKSQAAIAQRRVERELYRKHQSTHAIVVRGFREHLSKGRLVAWGRRSSPLADAMPIPASAWDVLKFDFGRSIAKEPTKSADRIFDVQIYPVLLAPQAAEILSDMSLRDVIGRYVFKDPELITEAKRKFESAEVDYAFGCGPAPGRLEWLKWPLNRLKQEITFEPLETKSFWETRPEFDLATLVAPVLPRILERFTALKRLLAEGYLVGEGLFVATGAHALVPPTQWVRRSVWVDAREGDLVEDEASRTPLRWNGIILRAAFPVKRTEYDGLPFATIKCADAGPAASKALVAAQTKAEMNSECVSWLVELMRASPKKRTHTKEQCRELAGEKWPRLSKLSFDDAWRQALRQSEANAWSAAGAPKRPQKNPPTDSK